MKDMDLFGSEIMFRFRGIATHNTKFGSIFTLCILGVIGLRLFFIVKEIFQRKSPTVIFQERQVDNPALFTINPKNFQMAFGVQDQSYAHFINPRIYTYEMQHQHKKTFIDEDGEAQTVWDVKNVELVKCTLANFDSDITVDYFKKQTYQNMLCLPPDQDFEIQGDFSSPDYQQLMLFIRACTGSNCEDPAVIDSILASAFFSLYFSDVFVDPTEKEDPFQRYARDMFWSTSTSFSQDSSWYLRNNYIESDFGWLYEDISTQYFPSFSQREISISPGSSRDYYFQLAIRMDKSKENVYQRKYKNVNNIISEIGGFTQSLLAIGFLICSRLSQLDLNKEIINEAFNFETIDEGKEEKEDQEDYQKGNNKGSGITLSTPMVVPQSSKQNRILEYGGGLASPTAYDLNAKKQMLSVINSQEELDMKTRTASNGFVNPNGLLGKFVQQIDQQIPSNNNHNNRNQSNQSNHGNLTNLQIDSSLSQTHSNLQPQTFMNAPFKQKIIRGNRRLSSSAHAQNESSYLSADLMMTGVNVASNQTQIRSANQTRLDLHTNNYNNDTAIQQGNPIMEQHKSASNNNHSHIKFSPTASQLQQNLNEQKKADSERKFLSFLIQNPGNGNLNQNCSGVYLPDSTMNQQALPTHLQAFQQHQKQAISSDHEKLQAQQQKLEEKLERQKESDFKRLMHKTTSSMSLNVWEYLKFFLWPFGEVKHKKKIIDYSIDKLYYHLDVLYVVKKLLEVDKLKRILLDQHQLKLFEYLPKPTIRTGITTDENGKEQLNMDIDKHYQDSRSELQKAQEAFVAYKSLHAKPALNQIDQNILNLLDPRLVDLFEVPFHTIMNTPPNENSQVQLNNSILAKQSQQQAQFQGNNNSSQQCANCNNHAQQQMLQQKQSNGVGSLVEQQTPSAISQFQSINQLPFGANNSTQKFQPYQVILESQGSMQHPTQQLPFHKLNMKPEMEMVHDNIPLQINKNIVERIPQQQVNQNQPIKVHSHFQYQKSTANSNNKATGFLNHNNSKNLQEEDEMEDQESNVNQMIGSNPINSAGDVVLNSPHHIDSNRSMFSEIASDEEKNKSYPLEFGMPETIHGQQH